MYTSTGNNIYTNKSHLHGANKTSEGQSEVMQILKCIELERK